MRYYIERATIDRHGRLIHALHISKPTSFLAAKEELIERATRLAPIKGLDTRHVDHDIVSGAVNVREIHLPMILLSLGPDSAIAPEGAVILQMREEKKRRRRNSKLSDAWPL